MLVCKIRVFTAIHKSASATHFVELRSQENQGEWQLFDVVKDPGESKDLSESMPEKLETLKTAWDQYANEYKWDQSPFPRNSQILSH